MKRDPNAVAMKPAPLTEADLDEIENEARSNAAETYRGALLALVAEVRRLRGIVLDGSGDEHSELGCP